MQTFTTLTGVAAPLPMVNVDTDKIIPTQLPQDDQAHRPRRSTCSTRCAITTDGNGEAGFRAQPASLPQGRDPGRRREFRLRLLARACALGAARFRHPLRDRASFADIFYNNCFKNGILPITVCRRQICDKLMDDAETRRQRRRSPSISSSRRSRGPNGEVITFDDRPVPQALPAQRPRRHRPDAWRRQRIDTFEASSKRAALALRLTTASACR